MPCVKNCNLDIDSCEFLIIFRDLRFSPQSKWDLRSSGISRTIDRYFATCRFHFLHGLLVRWRWDPIGCSESSVTHYRSMLRYIPEERGSQFLFMMIMATQCYGHKLRESGRVKLGSENILVGHELPKLSGQLDGSSNCNYACTAFYFDYFGVKVDITYDFAPWTKKNPEIRRIKTQLYTGSTFWIRHQIPV
jgi:hypothetical protein